MKKIVLVLVLTAFFVSAYSQNRKPLKGTYFEIVSDTSLHIYTEEGILSLKTFPTVFYWGEVDSTLKINTSKLDMVGTCDLTFKFKLYWDYYSYWNWYNPYRLKNEPTFTIKNVDLSNSFAIVDSFDTWVIRGVSEHFKINKNKIIIFSY